MIFFKKNVKYYIENELKTDNRKNRVCTPGGAVDQLMSYCISSVQGRGRIACCLQGGLRCDYPRTHLQTKGRGCKLLQNNPSSQVGSMI